jgi:hypothetical protein
MHPVKTGANAKKKRTVLIFVMALGVGLPPPVQAYLLDFTVASISPGGLISYGGGCPSGPPLVESNLKAIDASRKNDPRRQLSPAITPPKKNLNFPKGPLIDFGSHGPAVSSVWVLGVISPQDATTLQGGISCPHMSDGTSLLSGSFGTASVTEPAHVGENSVFYVAGSNFTDNQKNAWLAALGLHCQTDGGNFDPGCAPSFASVPSAFTGTKVQRGNILNHFAPFTSTLLLLGCGLLGLAGLRYRRRRG